MMLNKQAGKKYAKVFQNDKAAKDKISIMADEVKALAEVIESDRNIKEFFTSPINIREFKLTAAGNIVKRLGLSSYTLSLLELLIKKDHMTLLLSVSEELQEISDRINDRVRVTLTTAYEPSVSEIEELSKRISKYFKREVIVSRLIDPSIIGGFKLEGDGKLIDMSIKGQINRILSKV